MIGAPSYPALDVSAAPTRQRPAPQATADDGAVRSPRSVTRGERVTITAGASPDQVAKVDWLNATFDCPETRTPAQLVQTLSTAFGRPLRAVEGRGMFGFDRSMKLLAGVGSVEYPVGSLAWGGESQKGRAMLQLTGSGCGLVRSWRRIYKLLRALDARITRVDLCIDYLDGEYGVLDAVGMFKRGEFNSNGRPPSSRLDGDWLDGVHGRTLYVGKSEHGKSLRVYEKGRQLGNLESPWTRFEVQLGNRDRVIPLEVLLERDSYMAGCYPALADMIDAAAEQITTTRTEGAASLAHLMFHLKRSYGKLLHVVNTHLDVGVSELVESISIRGVPRRIKGGSVDSSLSWAQLLAQFTRKAKA